MNMSTCALFSRKQNMDVEQQPKAGNIIQQMTHMTHLAASHNRCPVSSLRSSSHKSWGRTVS